MKIRSTAIKLLKTLLVLLPVATLCMFGFADRKSKKQLDYAVFQTPAGWGYNILVDTTIVIHQEVMPATQTRNGFTNKKQAKAAALLVIRKVMQHQMPALSQAEVQHISMMNDGASN